MVRWLKEVDCDHPEGRTLEPHTETEGRFKIGDQITRFSCERVRNFRSSGEWPGVPLRQLLTDAAMKCGNSVAITGYQTGVSSPNQVTYAEVDDSAHRFAVALANIGLHPGDRIAVMLPNRAEYAAVLFGIFEFGGVYSGIPIAYGPRELARILRGSSATALVIAASWRGRDLVELVRMVRDDLPRLSHVIVIDGDSTLLGKGEHTLQSLQGGPDQKLPEVDPGDLCYLGFTSGTSGPPKGAMHNHETLMAGIIQFADHIGVRALGEPLVQLVGSPIGHHTGFHWGVLLNTYLRGRAVYVDEWTPSIAAQIVLTERVTAMFGAPVFLQDLLESSLGKLEDCPLEFVLLGGAPVPRNLPNVGRDLLAAYICPAWGMTEVGILLSCSPRLPDEVLKTDGAVVGSALAWIIGDDGVRVPAHSEGELVVDGPMTSLGYFEQPAATAAASTPDGGLRTGDNALIDDNGWVSLRGRRKDIIIRGGENIPVPDIESVIAEHPAVLSVALVGYEDERLGERVCAVTVLRRGAELTLNLLVTFLRSRGVSTHYLPERLLVVDALPMTPSGKVRKVELREWLHYEALGL